jgi:hypothetical protein
MGPGTSPTKHTVQLKPEALVIPPSSVECLRNLMEHPEATGEVNGKVCLVCANGRAFVTIGKHYGLHRLSIDKASAEPGFLRSLGMPEKLYAHHGGNDVSCAPGVFISGGNFTYIPDQNVIVCGGSSTMFGALDKPGVSFEGGVPVAKAIGELVVRVGAGFSTSPLDQLSLPPSPIIVVSAPVGRT